MQEDRYPKMEDLAEDESPMRPLRVPRRTPKACKQCRTSKIRCSGEYPCARCTKRGTECVFPSDEPHVSIPVSYFESLKRKAAAGAGRSSTPAGSEFQNAAVTFGNHSQDFTGVEERASKRPRTSASLPTPSSSSLPVPAGSFGTDLDPRLRPATSGLDALADASARATGAAAATPGNGPSPHNPLVGTSLSYIFDHVGRPRSLGPTSSWAYCRRALALLQNHSPDYNRPPPPQNLDGAAFRLRWEAHTKLEPSDVKNLPATEYTSYLYSTVQFHLGELWGIINDAHFSTHFKQFQEKPFETAKNNRLWFVEYLFILAFGKAFLNHPGNSTAAGPPGSDYASRAMSLMPDIADMHEEGVLAVEVLSLAALYFQSIDMRISAYQLVGQALRLAYIEGIHLHIPDDIVDATFSRRCNRAWWVVYILDREFTVMLGVPDHYAEDEITAPMGVTHESDLLMHGCHLRIRLSKLTAKTCTTVYGVGKGLGQPFIDNTTNVLQELAAVSRELESVISDYKQAPKGELPSIFRLITLSYHHCIVLATRPLVMWLFMLSIQSFSSEPQQLAAPIEALLHAGAESATNVLVMLAALAERNLLETFMPFQLEYTFSSGMFLSLLGAMLPSYIPDPNWQRNAFTILDEMISARNVVAPLRKAELREIEELLAPVRRHPFIASDVPAEPIQAGPSTVQERPPDMGPSAGNDGVSFSGALDDDTNFLPTWDEFYGLGQPMASGDFMLGLAEQLELGDLESSFLLS